MPLSTQIIREGEPMKLRWSDFHVAAMAIASVLELDASEDKLFEHPVEVRAELEEKGYPDEPTPITPSMAFNLADYGRLGLTPLNNGEVTLAKYHRFVDVTDGEVLELVPGDVLRAWRN